MTMTLRQLLLTHTHTLSLSASQEKNSFHCVFDGKNHFWSTANYDQPTSSTMQSSSPNRFSPTKLHQITLSRVGLKKKRWEITGKTLSLPLPVECIDIQVEVAHFDHQIDFSTVSDSLKSLLNCDKNLVTVTTPAFPFIPIETIWKGKNYNCQSSSYKD